MGATKAPGPCERKIFHVTMEHEVVVPGGVMAYRTDRTTNDGRVKYVTDVIFKPEDGPEEDVGDFKIEGPQGEYGLGFEEGTDIEPMNMTIFIEEAFHGRGISRHLVHFTCNYIRKSLSGLDMDLANKLVFIDTDASGGFWAKLGLLPTDDISDVSEMPHSVGTKRKRGINDGRTGWLTADQIRLIRAGYGAGYQGVISFGALCAWAKNSPGESTKRRRPSQRASTSSAPRTRRRVGSGRIRGVGRGRKRPCRTRSTKTIRRSRGGRRKARR